jgi:hypothetical protein
VQATAFKREHILDGKRMLSIDEYCWVYEEGRTTAYADIKAGRLRSLKRGRRRLIPREWAEEYHRTLPADGPIGTSTVETLADPNSEGLIAPADSRPRG